MADVPKDVPIHHVHVIVHLGIHPRRYRFDVSKHVVGDTAVRVVNVKPNALSMLKVTNRIPANQRMLAVMELDLSEGGKGRSAAIGLRNYFLVSIALELLAEDKVEVNFDELAQHPTVLRISGWPKESPSPEHIALTINQLLG